jgi:3-oxoacyl-[acyl-carrier-protein] synthase III
MNTATYSEQAYSSSLEKMFSENKISKGDIILVLGYGWGFSASACLLEF